MRRSSRHRASSHLRALAVTVEGLETRALLSASRPIARSAAPLPPVEARAYPVHHPHAPGTGGLMGRHHHQTHGLHTARAGALHGHAAHVGRSAAPPAVHRAHPQFTLAPRAARVAVPLKGSGGVTNPNPPSGAMTPAKIRAAYGLDAVTLRTATGGTVQGDGSGQTIAIVDAYDDPNIAADLQKFDNQYGLPNPGPTTFTFTKVNQSGGTAYPAMDPSGGWAMETALDVEWAHAVAPKANILLVEAGSANDPDLLTAVQYAAAHAGVVSMSWGDYESSGETAYDSTYFSHPGTAFVAASGDSGAPPLWPAVSPNVLAVGSRP